jgi:hypothetical protein
MPTCKGKNPPTIAIMGGRDLGGGALFIEPTSILYLIMKPKMGAWHCWNSLCTASSITQKKQTQKKTQS